MILFTPIITPIKNEDEFSRAKKIFREFGIPHSILGEDDVPFMYGRSERAIAVTFSGDWWARIDSEDDLSGLETVPLSKLRTYLQLYFL